MCEFQLAFRWSNVEWDRGVIPVGRVLRVWYLRLTSDVLHHILKFDFCGGVGGRYYCRSCWIYFSRLLSRLIGTLIVQWALQIVSLVQNI